MKTTFWQLLKNDIPTYDFKHGILIPMIQRDYVQGRTNPKSSEIRKQFLDDIRDSIFDIYNGKKNTLELDFVYGYIQNDVFIPLDGQQRLTTLFLLHWFFAIKKDLLFSYKEYFSKFRYQVRPSTDDFFRRLVLFSYNDYKEATLNKKKLSEAIINKNWFLSKWKYDNTIMSSLKMIDDIQYLFNEDFYSFELLTNQDLPPITFNFLDIKELGLSDDLYIKMNARGISLTSFENLKAELGKFIKNSSFNKEYQFEFVHNEGVANFDTETYFLTKIDTKWTDYFWNIRNSDNIFDDKLLNFLAYISLTNILTKDSEVFFNSLVNFRYKRYIPSFYQFHELGLLNESSIIMYIQGLDYLVTEFNYYKKYKELDFHYFNLEDILKESAFKINFELDATNRIRIYTMLKILPEIQKNQYSLEECIRFERLIYNLSSVPNFYNNYEDLSKSINGITNFINSYEGNLYNELITRGIEGFDNLQILEEVIKIILISKSSKWENLIIEIEKDKYLRGHIAILLHFADIFEYYNNDSTLSWDIETERRIFDNLSKYFSIYKMFFDDKGLKNYENEDFRSAMLCIGDYLIYSKNWNFIQNESRDVSWKRLFREVNNSKFRKSINILKNLFDEIDLKLSDKQNLQSIIKKYKPNVNDWRLEFANNPETIKLMTYYVKFNEFSNEIYLLNAPKFSSNAIDLDIYLIKKGLEKKGISTKIVFDEKYWKSIIKGIGSRQSKIIHYGIEEKNFVLIQYGKEHLVFENRKKVIDYIVNSQD